MSLLPPWLLVRLEARLGLRPALVPLSEGQVMNLLRHWLEWREGRFGDTWIGMPGNFTTEEPGLLFLASTIASKLGRLPRNPMQAEIPWQCSAVEASLYVEQALDDEQRALGRSATRAAIAGEERARRQRALDKARGALRKLRESAAYRHGIESLRWELAACAQDDQSIKRVVRIFT